jgi:hypothetical protein
MVRPLHYYVDNVRIVGLSSISRGWTPRQTKGTHMQRDTSSFQIDKANKLSAAIDAAAERPDELIREFDGCIAWLIKYAPHVEIDTAVVCPANW